MYPALSVQFIQGSSPTLIFFDSEENEVGVHDLSDLSEEGISQLLASYGITTDTPKFVPLMTTTEFCNGWRQTADCDPNGQREDWKDLGCNRPIERGMSGYCDCISNVKYAVSCDHDTFRCDEMCATIVKTGDASASGSPQQEGEL
jgi:hypothetical protein